MLRRKGRDTLKLELLVGRTERVTDGENTLTVLTPKGGSLKDYAFREAAYVFYRNVRSVPINKCLCSHN